MKLNNYADFLNLKHDIQIGYAQHANRFDVYDTFIDYIESLQQEVQCHITWNEAHTKARVKLSEENANLRKDLASAHTGYLDQIAQLQQEIEQFKSRLMEIKDCTNSILRDLNESDKVWIHAKDIMTVLSRCGEMRAARFYYVNNDLRKQIIQKDKALELAREASKEAAEILGDMCDVANTNGSAYLYRRDTERVMKVVKALREMGGGE